MKKANNYLKYNKETWNKRTDVHIVSDFYNVAEFFKGGTSLNEIELGILGDISGQKVLHLQCHFGQDTLSLARMGAKTTGVDLSDRAIAEANKLTVKLNLDAVFICCDLYDLDKQLNGKFDLVFTSYGAVGWLPDLDRWSAIIDHFLKPGGRFVMVEFHPVVWMFDDDFKKIKYRYFNSGPIIETFTGTYTDTSSPIKQKTVTWNHSLSEVISSLVNRGLEITLFNEYDFSPHDVFKGTEKIEKNKYRIKNLSNKIPMVYAIEAKKK